MTLTEKLMANAISTFGFLQASDAIFALKLLCELNGVSSDADWSHVFNKERWDSTLDQFRDHAINSGGGDAYAERLTATLPTWRMIYQLEVLPEPKTLSNSPGVDIQRLGYEPVDLGTVFHQNRLYYPVETLVTTKIADENGKVTSYEDLDIVVVRSDRTLHTVVESQSAGRGESIGSIFRLTDGTLLRERLVATQHATWSWKSVSAYLHDGYKAPPLRTLALKVYKHLRAKVWLPDPNDYWLLTFVSILSYVQAIFEAVPLVLLNGKGGTGKSGLGIALANVSCNATVIGKSSASSMIRLMNETKGLVVIDDLESIGAAAGKDKFSEMVQVLKVSYSKATATKLVTNTRRKPQLMNFFGLKVISNTSGVDAILGSRMLHVHTQNMPKSEIEEFLSREDIPEAELKELRNDLHCWSFDHVSEISHLYKAMAAAGTNRDEQITTPIRVLAKLSEIDVAERAVEESISRQSEKKMVFSSPEDALKHVIGICARSGLREVSVIEINLRLREVMRQRIPEKNRPVWMKPEWISKRLREWGLVNPGGGRRGMYGFQSRTVTLSDRALAETEPADRKVDIMQFCAGCRDCPYKSLACEIQPYRKAKEGLIS